MAEDNGRNGGRGAQGEGKTNCFLKNRDDKKLLVYNEGTGGTMR